MSEAIEIPGVVTEPGKIAQLLDAVEKEIHKLDAVGPAGCQFLSKFGVNTDREELEKAEKSLQRCRDLEKDFRVVRRDVSDIRAVRDASGNTIKIPLVFASKIPAKPIFQFNQGYSRVAAQTPWPTVEVGKVMV